MTTSVHNYQMKLSIQGAQIELPCKELDNNILFFKDLFGFRLDAIYPADDPVEAYLSGYGLSLRLHRGRWGPPGHIRLLCDDPLNATRQVAQLWPFSNGNFEAPNGTFVEFVEADPPLELPALLPSLVISRFSAGATWQKGRAGMCYRDLIPDRQGGRFIASHILIPDAGPVPDYVHYHKIHFQMIYCYKGWVRLVYEDQGPAFVMRAGDCVLQPPQIRHRVLESGDGLEVIEIGCPAEHQTLVEHQIQLPTNDINPDRDFGGQRFAFHDATKAEWKEWRVEGFKARDFGFAAATAGIARASVIKPAAKIRQQAHQHEAELCFLFVLTGQLTLELTALDDQQSQDELLNMGDSCVLPSGVRYRFKEYSDDLEFLEVMLPAAATTA